MSSVLPLLDAAGRRRSPATVASGSHPFGVAVAPNGKSAYVANFNDSTVSQYSIDSTGALSAKSPATVAIGSQSREVAVPTPTRR